MTRNKIIILIFLIALLSGFFWNQKIFGQPATSDQSLYNRIALNVLGGRGFTDAGRDAGMEPGYPLFLAGVYGLFGHNYDMVRIIQIFLFAFLAVFIFLIAEKLFGVKIALYSALATALFPSLAIEAGNVTTEMLFTFLLVGFGYAFSEATSDKSEYQSLAWFGMAGLILGAATLTRGIIQLLPVFIIVFIFSVYFKKIPMKDILFKIGTFLVTFILILGLWFAVHHPASAAGAVSPRAGVGLTAQVERMERFYPDFASHLIGQAFGYYFSEKLGLSGSYEDYRDTYVTAETANALIKSGKSDAEIDQQLMNSALKTILEEPHKYIAVSFLNFLSFNSPIYPRDNQWRNTLEIHPMFVGGRHPEISDWLKAIIILSIRFIWFLFFGLIIYALIKNIKEWRRFGCIFLVILYLNLTYSALHAIPRYALPIYPFYFILAIWSIMNLLKKKDENLLSN
ncbi:MAG: glycosyltransferase family 39 protein [bacterium]|nr:glycosyltransferase family 39 protein [bacterium]